ncbi:Uncharacterised protein [Serratia marcescens]|nr:hypothetical protein SM14VA7_42400 [Serratia marcescens]CAI1877376.1 Uncharacterised protein [Serratia marcescens]CAI2120567.1 Uncharacterised protein [Serratia marcescens]CAI2146235.1 Uncharacterised protein [Serratia marcescens]CVG82161.1 Uncharacterised protein [Serratia marcescens]
MPLWAIGGMMVVISIFWVENYSSTIMEKTREMRLTSVVTRTSMVERGTVTANAGRLAEATGANMNQATHAFSAELQETTLEKLQELKENKRISELLATTSNVSQNTNVPFDEINKTIGLDPEVRISTADNAVKVFRPLHVIIAVEASSLNRANVMQARAALMSSLSRLYAEAPTTRTTVIPYSFRVNSGGKCYTGIARSDAFSFVWWENFFAQEDYLAELENTLRMAEEYLGRLNAEIDYSNQMIIYLNNELSQHDPGTQEYKELTEQISYYQQEIRLAEAMLPMANENIKIAKENVDAQKEVIDNLKQQQQYIDYFPLAKHYAKRYDNYYLLDDYTDNFANSGIFSITQSDFERAAKTTYQSAEYLSSLAVKRGVYFGDAGTCPASTVKYGLTSSQNVNSALSGIDFSTNKIKTLEGLLWAGRTAFSASRGMARNVIILFASDTKEVIDPDEVTGIRQSCAAIKTGFINNKSAKLIVVTQNQDGRDKFEELSCATQWFTDPGYINLEDINNESTPTLEEQFNFIFSQESTTRNINAHE